MAGKQSQANKNFWYAYALWQQKVAQALARRRAEELARKRAEAEARARQAQSSSQSQTVNPVLALLAKLIPTAQKVVKLATIGVALAALASLLMIAGSVVQDGAVGGVLQVGVGLVGGDTTVPTQYGPLDPKCLLADIEYNCGGGGYGGVGGGGSSTTFAQAPIPSTGVKPVITPNGNINNLWDLFLWLLLGGAVASDVGVIDQPFPQTQIQPSTHPLENDDTDVRPTDGVVNPNRPDDDDQYIILYHYTLENRVNRIISEGLFSSIQPLEGGDDARYGDGQYFTDLTPEEASTVTRGQLAYALFNDFQRWGFRTPIAWMRFQFRIEDVRRVAQLYGSRFPNRSIYLRGGTDTLSMSGIFLDTGLVTFSMNE